MGKDVDANLIVGTELDTTGLEDGLKDIKNEYDDEVLEIPTEKSEKGLKKILSLSKKIGRSMLGVSATALKFATSIIGLVAKLGLIGGLIGILALVGMGIVKAFQSAIEKDEELQTKLEYLKYAMATAFEGIGNALVNVFKWLIDRLYDLMVILGVIIKLLTGFNIFSKATADNFKNANKNAGALKKTLAGFDEMNILNEDGSTGILGVSLPDVRELGKEVETWTQKFKNWLYGGHDNIWEALKYGPSDAWNFTKDLFSTTYDKIIKPYIVDPLLDLGKLAEPIWRPIYNTFVQTIEDIKKTFQPFIDFINNNLIDPIKKGFEKFKNDFLLTFAPFLNMIIKWINDTFGVFGVKLDYIEVKSDKTGDKLEENLVDPLKESKKEANDLTKNKYDVNISTKKPKGVLETINDIWNTLNKIINKTWNVTFGAMFKDIKSTGIFGYAKGGIYYPKLASGGLINQPGRGVPYRGAVIGEKGTEGILPLTDSQQMELLGEAIGRYITINANIVNSMNGRIISRELQKVQNESSFAGNR